MKKLNLGKTKPVQSTLFCLSILLLISSFAFFSVTLALSLANISAGGQITFTAASKIEFTDYDDTNLTCSVKAKSSDISGDVVIPSTTIKDGKTYTITEIAESAFSECHSLTDISIPDSITIINEGAFFNCTSLNNVTIPSSVTSLGFAAFNGCSSFTSVTVPDSVTSLNCTFGGCTSLTNVYLPNSITTLENGTFNTCTSLVDITIPDSVTLIGKSCFAECTALTNITIPDAVTEIGDSAFLSCTSLTSIVIPINVTTIGDHAFANAGLTSATFKIPYWRAGSTVLSVSDIRDPATAATYLTTTYTNDTWKRG